jgi:hypothetical protein
MDPECACLDFNRAAEGTTKSGIRRVYLQDLNILSTNWNIPEPTKGPGIVKCPLAGAGGEINYYKSP